MKIPASVRDLYQDLLPRYQRLKDAVDSLMLASKEARWHYESRIKSEESFALKLETGRIEDPQTPDDLFACTMVVENHGRITDAERMISDTFNLRERRPVQADRTPLPPYSFDFDDLRLYLAWRDDPAQRPSGLVTLVFEVQVKTFLQHAWTIATHDLVYKTTEVDWATSRIAYQVKAMLENAELSISEARRLTDAALLNKEDRGSEQLRRTIEEINRRWQPDQLPKDLRRLAQNLGELIRVLRMKISDLWTAVDEATAQGEGTHTRNLSPYGAIVASLLRQRGPSLLEPLAQPDCKGKVFVPAEVDLPDLSERIKQRIIRPMAV